ncbi:MAG: peptidoglycan recognition family protein [Cyanobium sp.]
MNHRLPPLLTAVLATAALSLGAIAWLVSEIGARGGLPGSSRDLEDLMQARPPQPEPRRAAPRPPLLARWDPPAARRCPATDSDLELRMLSLDGSLEQRTRRIATDPTNFGVRYSRDAFGNPLDPTPRVIVLHETVYGMESAIQTFLTPHPRDEDQVSYHMLIGADGEIVQVLDPSKRAFGAGNSAFEGEWAVTNPKVGGSINNFALHLSLETPPDGEHNGPEHSGYSAEQYDAMALVLADWMRRFQIPWQRITTHRHVDLGGERADPRSFDWQALQQRLIALGVVSC